VYDKAVVQNLIEVFYFHNQRNNLVPWRAHFQTLVINSGTYISLSWIGRPIETWQKLRAARLTSKSTSELFILLTLHVSHQHKRHTTKHPILKIGPKQTNAKNYFLNRNICRTILEGRTVTTVARICLSSGYIGTMRTH